MNPIIQAEQLKFEYGNKTVLKDINFSVNAGEIIGLIGENGAGKTTLLKILLGMLSASGSLSVFGQAPGSQASKTQIGSMYQTDMIIQGVTVSELLIDVAANYAKPLNSDQLISQFHLTEIANSRLTELSGGQQRRVNFAVALVGNPELLFLDEPTVGMDVDARQDFWKQIELLKHQGKTIIITSHYLNEIQDVADRIMIMKNGKFIFQGSFDVLQKQHQQVKISFQTALPKEAFTALPSVTKIDKIRNQIYLNSTNGDVTLYALINQFKQLQQITVSQESLEDIFVQLTKGGNGHEKY